MRHIPLLRISGPHRAAGEQIGAACRDVLQRALARSRSALPPGESWDDMCRAAGPYRQATRAALPWIVEELDGCAAGCGMDARDLWPLAVEELWRQPPAAAGQEPLGRCTDFVAGPPATFDGGVWVAHNNDLAAHAVDDLVALHWQVPGQPEMFTVGAGPFISVGINAAGLCLTGNEVSPNDDRPGVPRLLIVRDILAQPRAEGAIAAAVRPERASSYNNVITHRDGTILSVEGSASDYALITPRDGWLVHANHYVCDKMLRYECGGEAVGRSAVRYRRACELMATRPGPVTPQMLRAFLSDHASAPQSVCRHGEEPAETVFWCVVDVCHAALEFGGGRPCEPGAQRWAF